MSNLTIFQFESQEVRCVGTADDPWWVAADVCTILGITVSLAVNGRERKAKDNSIYHDGGLDEDEKGVAIVNTLGGDQEMLVVNEPGLYRLIFKSRKPVARRFQRWVYHEVLPTIRKTGSYAIAQTTIQPQEPQPALPPAVPTPQEISELADLIYSKTAVPPELQAGKKANAIAHHHPALKPTMEIFKTALSIPVESELLSPTQLGQILGSSTNTNYTARQINKLLLSQGFQERNPDGGNNPAYLPTDKGKQYCKVILNTAQGRDKTIQSLRWFKDVLEALEMNDH